jgi:hypothetical protein
MLLLSSYAAEMPELMGINPNIFNQMDPASLASFQKMAAQV